MNLDYNFFKVDDGQFLAYKKWDNVENPKGVVIIIHGMAEHIERYDGLASFLNGKGLIVYGTDQRGHGKTSGKKGLFTYDKGWKRVVKDQVEFFHFVQNSHSDLDVSFIAHSMGSFISRALISLENLPINKIILSGTGFEPRAKAVTATAIAGIISKVKGPGQDGIYLDSMVNNPLAASIKDPTTAFDWLSRDKTQVAKYINDSNCGFVCTNQFFRDFFKIISIVCTTNNIKKIDKDLPILLYSGEKDPVGGKDGVGVKKLHEIYTEQGLNVQIMFNEGGRHESINETNREEVYNNFSTFLLK